MVEYSYILNTVDILYRYRQVGGDGCLWKSIMKSIWKQILWFLNLFKDETQNIEEKKEFLMFRKKI